MSRGSTRKGVLCPLLCMAAALIALPSAACDESLEAAVAANPDRTDSRDALARSCGRAGRHDAALAQYNLLIARDDGNVDWLLGKSQALVALRRPAEAVPLLERARAIAPGYEDVWRLYATVLESLDAYDRADAFYAEAARTFPASGWPAERRHALAERRLLARDTRLSIDASYEDLSGGRPAWRGATVGIGRRLDDRRRVLAGLHLEERFDRRDEQLAFTYAERLSADWSYGVSGDVSPDAEVLPEWSLVAEADRALPGGRNLGLRARHASYATVDVDSLAATIEQYTERFRVAYTLNAAKPSDINTSFGHLLRVAHDYGRDSNLGFAVGYGEEAETIAPGVVQVTDIRSISLSGLHWHNAAWGIAWEAGWYEQGDLYDRIRIRLGLEHRF
jgi:YaiO family outer membrane protein